jgi:hypothetical protein
MTNNLELSRIIKINFIIIKITTIKIAITRKAN